MSCCVATKARCVAQILVLVPALGCNVSDLYIYSDGTRPPGMEPPGDGSAAMQRDPLRNAAEVFAFLQSSTWLMEPDAIPSHPNGYDENINYGQATQCLHRSRIEVNDRAFSIASTMGTLLDAPKPGDAGRCDRATSSGTDLHFDTTAALIENVRGDADCFDITLTYSGFGQEGRGRVTPEGDAIELELFFRDQAVGHRCAQGEVGAPSVTLNQELFGGDAVQVYSRVP